MQTITNSTRFNVTGLVPDTTYTFEVSAVTEVFMGSGGEGERSDSVEQYLLSDGTCITCAIYYYNAAIIIIVKSQWLDNSIYTIMA